MTLPSGGGVKAVVRVERINRVLNVLLPLLALVIAIDLVRWGGSLRRPAASLPPALEEWGPAPVALPHFELPASAFRPVQPPKPVVVSQVEIQARWKLKGSLMGATRRAFLEDEAGKGFWVAEGESLGSCKVKEISERSVLLEEEGKSYEIRL